jgi:hypothetical protein
MEKLRIIVGGYLGLYPTGGATWDYIQYPLGLHLLGHDVYYFEDTAVYPMYQADGDKWDDCSETVRFIKTAMENVRLNDRWAYKDVATMQWFGMSKKAIDEIFETADIFINVSSATYVTEQYLKIPKRVLIDTDPMFTQVEFWKMMNGTGGDSHRLGNFLSHNYFFTFGLNVHGDDCAIPHLGLQWHTTKKPICTQLWNKHSAPSTEKKFTSILNWVERPPFEYDSQTWGQKNIIFKQFETTPQFFPDATFELIVNTTKNEDAEAAMYKLRDLGWSILDPNNCITNMNSYNDFIQQSYAEFSITKETYIKSNSGWFSGRSACYLAAGRPVITQDTTWSNYIPAGKGLFGCNDLESAKQAIIEINADYSLHSKSAKEIAHEYFDSAKILSDILETVNQTSNVMVS